VRVSLANPARSFSVTPTQSVLEAALQAGLNLPHSCRGGNCGACRARLLGGQIGYRNGPPLGLSAAEAAEGYILLCQAEAHSDLSIDIAPISQADEVSVKRLPCRIEQAQLVAHDVLQLALRLPAAEAFEFKAGQYVDILLPRGRRRSYSIASPPHDARLLELHVRRVPGGAFSDGLFEGDARNKLLSLEGPLGGFYYREDAARPLLLIGGGTGLAPLKSILRHVLETGAGRDVTLYWGVRAQRDLYAHAWLSALARQDARLTYEVVLSEPDATWTGRRGWVHEAVLDALDVGNRYDVYTCGPPALIEAVRTRFVAQGADPAHLFFDSFDYARD
jgi:CDP-4-dehydro-6-deoxyglucose reductase